VRGSGPCRKCGVVRSPFDDFAASPPPGTLDTYFEYRQRAIEFIESRNRRIAAYVSASTAELARRFR
jgi:hypothetical protein